MKHIFDSQISCDFKTYLITQNWGLLFIDCNILNNPTIKPILLYKNHANKTKTNQHNSNNPILISLKNLKNSKRAYCNLSEKFQNCGGPWDGSKSYRRRCYHVNQSRHMHEILRLLNLNWLKISITCKNPEMAHLFKPKTLDVSKFVKKFNLRYRLLRTGSKFEEKFNSRQKWFQFWATYLITWKIFLDDFLSYPKVPPVPLKWKAGSWLKRFRWELALIGVLRLKWLI